MVELERKHLLLLFALGVMSKGFVKVRLPSYYMHALYECSPAALFCVCARRLCMKSAFGANVSLILLLSVALYYWRVKHHSQTVYDDIARMQVEAAAKLDKLNGVSDGKVTEMDLHVRKTQFKLDPDDVTFITDRMHQYSRKFAGSHADRRKFLVKNRRKKATGDDDSDDQNEKEKDINALPSIGEIRGSDAPLRARKGGKKSAIESAVEDAVDRTL